MDVSLEAIGHRRRGPKAHILDSETEEFIIEAIEVYRSSFSTVGKLLEEKGILTPKGSKRWFPASVKRQYDRAVKKRLDSREKPVL